MARKGGTPENLRPPFPPGVSGNPGGRPKLPPELRAIKELTAEEINRTIAKYARMTKAELSAAITHADTPIYELHIASILATGAKIGDPSRLGFLFDRSIGKVATDVVISKKIREEIDGLSDAELIEIAKTKLLPEGK